MTAIQVPRNYRIGHCAASAVGKSLAWLSAGGLLLLALVLCCNSAAAQESPATVRDYTKDPEWFPAILKPYRPEKLPQPDFKTTSDVSQMTQDGVLRLSVAQLVSAVMENNLTISAARYNRSFSQTDVLRAKAGGAPRGSQGVVIPSGLFAGALGSGLGGEIGVSPANGPAISGNPRLVTINPRGNFDPNLNFNFSIDRSSSPLNSLRVAGVVNSITSSLTLQSRYSQAFTSGTSFSVSFNAQRTSSNQANLRFQPAYTPSLNLVATQRLLNGFGFDFNRRFLDVAKNGRQIAREVYRQQVTNTLVQAQNNYWDLVAFRETVRAAEQSLQVAQQLYENNQKQAEVGTLARLDVTSAESEVAARRRDMIVAQTNLQQAEVQLKSLMSKQMDPGFADARVEATDPLPQPQDADIPKLEDALANAVRNRPELPQGEGNIRNNQITAKFSGQSLKPSLYAFGFFTSSSLYGDQIVADPTGGAPIIVPGGVGTSLGQVFGSDFPDFAFGIALTIPLKNRSAQADNMRARLEELEAERSLQNTQNQIALEVRNAVIGLMQAKSRVESAEKALEFERQTVDAEQKKLAAGVSTSYNVILVQRDLLSAELAEVQARTNYAKARVEMERAMGVTLERNHIDPAEVPRAEFPSASH